MSIVEDFAPYKDSYGLIHPEIGKISGNGIRYTCEYYWAAKLTGVEVGCIPLNSCELIDGLLIRHPSNPYEQEGPDDYVARISLPDGFSKRFLQFGRGHGFYYNNTKEPNSIINNPKAYLGRQQQIICHAMWAAGEEPDIFLKAWWVVALMQSAFSKKQDSKILGWYLVKVAKGRSKYIDSFIVFWQWMFKKHYPNGVGQVLKEYFGSDEHPSVKYLWDEFG